MTMSKSSVFFIFFQHVKKVFFKLSSNLTSASLPVSLLDPRSTLETFVADPFFDPNDISYNQVLTADMAITTHSNPYVTDYNLHQNRDLSLDRGFVWADWTASAIEPVPEPSTLAIFALGLMGLASRRFKKQ